MKFRMSGKEYTLTIGETNLGYALEAAVIFYLSSRETTGYDYKDVKSPLKTKSLCSIMKEALVMKSIANECIKEVKKPANQLRENSSIFRALHR